MSSEVLAEAAEKMKWCEWMAAAILYEGAMKKVDSQKYPLEAARIGDIMADCFFRGSFQSQSKLEFSRRMELAKAGYARAERLYQAAGLETLAKRTRARVQFANFWIKDESAEKRIAIQNSISLAEESAQELDQLGDKRGSAEAYRDLLACLLEGMPLETDWKVVGQEFQAAVLAGERAVDEFAILHEDSGLVESLHLTLLISSIWFDFVLEPSKVGEIAKKIQKLSRQIVDVSERIGTPYAFALATEAAAFVTLNLGGDFSKAFSLFEAGVSLAKKIMDSLMIGRLSANYVFFANFGVAIEEDVERRRLILMNAIIFAETALENLGISYHTDWLGATRELYASCHVNMANLVETEAERKREHLRKAIEIAKHNSLYENYMGVWIGDALSRAMYFLAKLDVDPVESAQLLTDSLPIREKIVRNVDLRRPYSIERAMMRNQLALIKAELSALERDPLRRIEYLQSAVANMQECVEICVEWAPTAAKMSAFAHHLYYERYGDFLLQLYQLTRQIDVARRAVRAYEDAISSLTDSVQHGPVPAICWKIARVHDTTGTYKDASDAFRKAAVAFSLAAKKVPGSSAAYGELALYMEAWSVVEEARLHHNDEEYRFASEKYGIVASLLQTTRNWAHLSELYAACSLLEEAEALSRHERPEASVESFRVAVKAFQKTEEKLASMLRGRVRSEERLELEDWLEITAGREEYCRCRIELEEAEILDRRGEKAPSSAKYLSASRLFKELLTKVQRDQTRNELETFALFSEAWAMMKDAEVKSSPDIYEAASKSFLTIEGTTSRQKERILALASASMCKALEFGTLFRRTRNTELYSEIKKQLETSADYFGEGGFKGAAAWTRATRRLFDALVYITDAEVEREPKKRTELYELAEKHLVLAARLYDDAGFQGKKQEALGYLQGVREEKQLLLTPIEALEGNPIALIGSVSPPSLIRDQAVGLERLEAVNIVGNLVLRPRELTAGSPLSLELEITNIGRTTATLLRLENVAPKNVELDMERVQHKVHDSFIDMKGKRLEYLQAHQLSIPLKALRKGTFQLRPRIAYADEQGNHGSYQFEPESLTVRELGIKRWLQGPK